MPLLGGLVLSLFQGLFGLIALYVTKRVAVVAAAVATVATITTAFYAACAALVVGVMSGFPGGVYALLGVWLVVPDNAGLCVAAIVAADAAVALYRFNIGSVKVAASAA